MNPSDSDATKVLPFTVPGIPQETDGFLMFWNTEVRFPRVLLVKGMPTWSLPWSPAADRTRLCSRSSAKFQSTGVVVADRSVQSTMAKVAKSAEAWTDTH